MRKAIAVSVILLLAANLMTACSPPEDQPDAIPTVAAEKPTQLASGWTDALRPETAERDLAYFAQAPVYRISLDYEPESRALSGTQAIRYTNVTDQPLTTLYLLTKAPAWGEDANEADRFSLSALQVNGKPAAHTQENESFTVPLAEPLAPGATVDLAFAYRAHLPIFRQGDPLQAGKRGANPGTYGAIDSQTHGLTAAIPLAVPDRGQLESQFILWDVTVTLPADWKVIGSGVSAESTLDGRKVTHVLSASYSLYLFAARGLQSASADVDGVTVTVHYPGNAGSVGPQMLEETAHLLRAHEALLGPYPFPELEILPLAYNRPGENRSGLVMIDAFYLSNRSWTAPATVTDPWLRLVLTDNRGAQRRQMLAHEIAHSWWGDLVWEGTRAPSWMEGITEASAIASLERLYGAEASERARNQNRYYYQLQRARGLADVASGRPRPESMDPGEYYAMSYHKPALFYDRVRQLVGDEVFFAAMRRYIEQNRFGVTADGGPIEELLGEPEARTMHQRWLLETHGDEDIGLLTPDQLTHLGLSK